MGQTLKDKLFSAREKRQENNVKSPCVPLGTQGLFASWEVRKTSVIPRKNEQSDNKRDEQKVCLKALERSQAP